MALFAVVIGVGCIFISTIGLYSLYRIEEEKRRRREFGYMVFGYSVFFVVYATILMDNKIIFAMLLILALVFAAGGSTILLSDRNRAE